jgi:hypothetical protein
MLTFMHLFSWLDSLCDRWWPSNPWSHPPLLRAICRVHAWFPSTEILLDPSPSSILPALQFAIRVDCCYYRPIQIFNGKEGSKYAGQHWKTTTVDGHWLNWFPWNDSWTSYFSLRLAFGAFAATASPRSFHSSMELQSIVIGQEVGKLLASYGQLLCGKWAEICLIITNLTVKNYLRRGTALLPWFCETSQSRTNHSWNWAGCEFGEWLAAV